MSVSLGWNTKEWGKHANKKKEKCRSGCVSDDCLFPKQNCEIATLFRRFTESRAHVCWV